MTILKFWYVFCTVYCVFSLINLANQRYEVNYLATTNLGVRKPSILACKALSFFYLNETGYELNQLRADLYSHFNTSKNYQSFKKDKNKDNFFRFLDRIKTGDYLIFNDQLCTFTTDNAEREAIWNFLSKPAFYEFENSTTDFFEISNYMYVEFDQLVTLKKGYPYSSCSERNNRFRCLNKCFKRGFRLSRYFYDRNETGLIRLSTSPDQSVEEHEKNCFQECREENCKIIQFFPKLKKAKTTTLKAHPKQKKIYYWVTFIGLVCSFANISLNKLASIVIRFASSKVTKRKVRIGLIGLKWTIFVLSLAYCCYLYTSMTRDQLAKEKKPDRKEVTRNHIKQKIIRLAVSVNVNKYLGNSYYINIDSLRKTMSEIENATNKALENNMEGVYLNYQGKMFRVNYITESKVLLKRETYSDEDGFSYFILNRYFILLIRPDYQLMPSNPKLTIKLKDSSDVDLYLLTENENLNEKSFKYNPDFAFGEEIVRRLNSLGNCTDYEEKYWNCTSRSNCVESCINREALRKFERIGLNKLFIDKDQFSSTAWNTIHPMEIGWKNNQDYINITKRCENAIPEENPCYEIKFNETAETLLQIVNVREIDLFLDVSLSVEEFSWFNLLLNIMNIHNIFFSLTVLKVLRIISNFLKPKLKIQNDKTALFLIYLLCSIGFSWHTYKIFDLSINSELTNNLYYEMPQEVHMPTVVLCHQIDENRIDKNHKLTGNYLEKLTSNMTAENVFRNIAYLDELNGWTSLNLSLVEPFFLINLKCFRIRISQDYNRRNLRRKFYFSAKSQLLSVLKVNFTETFVDPKTENQTVYFMTQTNETTGFSNIGNLFYKYRYGYSEDKYLADQSELTVIYEDHLSFIKRHLLTDYEDGFNHLDRKLPVLKGSEYGFGTTKNPVEREDFDCELKDDLFDQFFYKFQNAHKPGLLQNTNFEKTSFFNQIKRIKSLQFLRKSDPDLTFSLVLPKKILSVQNEASLFLGLLNVLFWFDLAILDLHPIISHLFKFLLNSIPSYLDYLLSKIIRMQLFCSKWLKKCEPPLYKRLKARKENSPETT